jgi:hypothetical protein
VNGPTTLPRAVALTGALTASAPVATEVERLDVLERLERGLAAVATAGSRLRVDGFMLRSTLGLHRHPAGTEPFRWCPKTARRPLGLAAVRACLCGLHRAPGPAVAEAIAQTLGDTREGSTREGSLAGWLAAAPGAARAAAQAEAVTWATQLLGALNWSDLRPRPRVGGRDDWWSSPTSPVVLRGRAEARVALTTPTGHRATALFCMLAGHPDRPGRAELGLTGLAGVLAAPESLRPARVMGYWPECGRVVVLDLDYRALATAAGNVVAAVSARSRPDRRTPPPPVGSGQTWRPAPTSGT